MQPIPDDIIKQFDTVLEEKAVPVSLRNDYRKWLRYYLDFRVKYPPPDAKSEQVRLFIEKMRSMIYTHCVPSKTIQELAGPLDF